MILGYDVQGKPIKKNCKAMIINVMHTQNSHLIGTVVTPVERWEGFLGNIDGVIFAEKNISNDSFVDACLCKNLMVISPDEKIKQTEFEKEVENV